MKQTYNKKLGIEDGDDDGYYVRLEHHTCWEETKEEVLKKQIIAELRRYLTAAARLSQKIGSQTYKNWTEMLSLLENYNGEFYGWNSQANLTAKKDLQRFISLFKPARQQIWSDVKVFSPEAHKAVANGSSDDIKAATMIEAFQNALGSTPIEIKDTTVKKIRGSFDDVAANVNAISLNTRPPTKDRDDIIALVRDVRVAKIKGVTSYPKATEYVRRIAEPSDEKFYERCAWARAYAKSHAKKSKVGQDKFWSSIAQNAKPSAAKQRAKAKSNRIPGITPTLHN